MVLCQSSRSCVSCESGVVSGRGGTVVVVSNKGPRCDVHPLLAAAATAGVQPLSSLLAAAGAAGVIVVIGRCRHCRHGQQLQVQPLLLLSSAARSKISATL